MSQRTVWVLVLGQLFFGSVSLSIAQITDIKSTDKTSTLTSLESNYSTKPKKSVDTVRLSSQSFYNPNTSIVNDVLLSCQVRFRQQPKYRSFSAKTSDGVVKRYVYSSTHKEIDYSLEIVEYPPKFLESRNFDIVNKPYDFLERQLDAYQSTRKKNRVLYRERMINSRLPGMELYFSFPAGVDKKSKSYASGVTHRRMYVRDFHVYSLTVSMTEEKYKSDSQAAKTDMLAFVDSFNIRNENLKRMLKPPTFTKGIFNAQQ